MLTSPEIKYQPYVSFCLNDRKWPDKQIASPPIWCSVDLRDGNQALVEPMDIDKKMIFFEKLVELGFKEIEVGFPSASEVDFNFVRKIIDEDLVPDDVKIQVLTPCRKELILRTFEALNGAKNAIVHFYNATAPVMRKVVFNKSKKEVIQMAVDNASLIKSLTIDYPNTNFQLQYSPEMFSNTESDFSLDVINSVIDELSPTRENKLIVNLPATIECMSPNVFADQVEWFCRKVKKRGSIIVSVHPHNDRGTSVAAAELAMMAGAERLEGCLFGNGERTGNLDLVNVALNMYTHGVSPGLDFSRIDEVKELVTYCNQLPIHARHPYVGELVYTSFSGTHQDAIRKAFLCKEGEEQWDIPYLILDPQDLGRDYEAIIRVNSQSGKGGVAYILEHKFGLKLPRGLQIDFQKYVQETVEKSDKALTPADIWNLFESRYFQNIKDLEFHSLTSGYDHEDKGLMSVNIKFSYKGIDYDQNATGNGPIDAVVNALNSSEQLSIEVRSYLEHSISKGSDSQAVCYISTSNKNGEQVYGVGLDENIIISSVKAIFSSVNNY
ncbi:2-isopropylmalate synthase [Vibrio sp. 10N.247.311.18]|uniref:2-isopropylmalate synthase n=1 Tax=unclassified Vibrio TaxID=2614977 RepID=UPI00354DDD75